MSDNSGLISSSPINKSPSFCRDPLSLLDQSKYHSLNSYKFSSTAQLHRPPFPTELSSASITPSDSPVQFPKPSRELGMLRSLLDQSLITREKQDSLLVYFVSMHCQLKDNLSVAQSTIQAKANSLISEIEILKQEALDGVHSQVKAKERELNRKKENVKSFLEDLSEVIDKLEDCFRHSKYTERHASVQHTAKGVLSQQRTENDIDLNWLQLSTDHFSYRITPVCSEIHDISSIRETEVSAYPRNSKEEAITLLLDTYKTLEERISSHTKFTHKPVHRKISSYCPTTSLRKPGKKAQISALYSTKAGSLPLHREQLKLYIPSKDSEYSHYYVVTVTPSTTCQQLLQELVIHMQILGDNYVLGYKPKPTSKLKVLSSTETIARVQAANPRVRLYLFKT